MSKEQRIVEAITLYQDNPDMPVREILRRYGLKKRSTFYSWLKKAGVSPNRHGSKKRADWGSIQKSLTGEGEA